MTISEKCTIGGVDYFITLPDSVLLASTGQIYAATTVNFTTNATASGVTRASIDMAHGVATFGGGGSDYKAILGPLTGFETADAALWFLAAGTARTAANVSLYGEGTGVFVNAPSSAGTVGISAAGAASAVSFNFNTDTTTLGQTNMSLPNIATSATFSAGGIAPGNITGFIVVKIAGTDRKIPYYAT